MWSEGREDIGLLEVLALKEERLAGDLGEGISEAVAEFNPAAWRPLPKSWKAWRAICACSTVTGSISMPMRRNSASHCRRTSAPN